MYKYKYDNQTYYINVENIAYIKLYMHTIPGISKYVVLITYTENVSNKFTFDTEEEAIELADNMAEYIINSHNKCCTH